MTDARTNLLGFSPVQLIEYCQELNEKPFRAKQLQRWIHQFGVGDFSEMTDLAKSLRGKLELCAEVKAPEILKDTVSSDGTRKWLLDVGAGNAIETVFIPEETRGTLCVSTQAGCAVKLPFLFDRQAGFFPQSDDGGNHRAIVDGRVRCSPLERRDGCQRRTPDIECRHDGHG